MINLYSRIRFELLVVLLLHILLCCETTVSAQKTTRLFFEKVYLHTDREHYTSGEDIWFKAYVLNGQTHQLLNLSNNLHIELIYPEGKISERRVIRLNGGVGNGDIHIPDSLASGTYRLRAYTNWMRNFGDNFLFEKRINVVSKVEKLNVLKTKGNDSVSTDVTIKLPNFKAKRSSFNITFFPEGGSSIENVSGIVAFKAQDSNGKGISASGAVYSAKGEKVTDFKCDSFGMGRLVLLPESGTRYEARGTYESGDTFISPLPTALAKGFSMYVRNTDSLMRVIISTNSSTLIGLGDRPLKLIGRHKGKLSFESSIVAKDLQTPIVIPKSSLPQGIILLTLYDNEGRPHCERLVYCEGDEKAAFIINTNKANYSPKEKVTLTLKVINQDKRSAPTKLSVAVVDAGIVPDHDGNILTYLNLDSELKGRIQNAIRYFDKSNSKRHQQLDLLLSTHGWRDFIWKRLADSTLRISYPPEQGITISGRVREISKDEPVMGANVTLSAFGAKEKRLFSARTDSGGKYYFDGVQLFGTQPIKLTSRNVRGEKLGWITMNSLSAEIPPVNNVIFDPGALPHIENFTKLALERKRQAEGFSLSDTVHLNAIQIKARSSIRLSNAILNSFGYKDEVFNVDPKDHDHADLRHYLLHYSSASSDSDNYLRWFYAGAWHYPKLIVNNKELRFDDKDVEVRSAFYNQYLSLPVSKVKKIVIKHLIGTRLDNPSTKTEDFYVIYLTIAPDAFDKKEYDILQAEVTGYYEARVFFAPNYEESTAKQDFRTTIHWEPNIITDANGEARISYFNGDPKTRVRIVAEGITNNGIPCVGSLVYDVK